MSLIPSTFLDIAAADIYPTTVTFQESPDGGAYANVTGLVSIQARLQRWSPGADFMQQRAEMRGDFDVQVGASHTCYLRGLYRTVGTGMRMMHGTDEYQVLSVRHMADTMTIVALSGTQAVV